MKLFSRIVLCLFVIAAIVGCASSTITSRQEYQGGKIARPDHIIVYDFAATPADVPDPHCRQYLNSAQRGSGRQVGAEIAKVLVEDIRAMGLPAERGSSQTVPRIGDLVIKGNILSINEGSAAERVAIGFGSGAAQLKAAAAGYLMTDQRAPETRLRYRGYQRKQIAGRGCWALPVPLRPATLRGSSSAPG